MRQIGIFCTDDGSHLRTHLLLGRELQRRGHRVTAFNISGAQERVRREGLDFCSIGERQYTPQERYGRLMSGPVWNRTTLERIELACRNGPELVRASGVDLLLVDQLEPGGTVVAERLGLPFVSVCNALPWNSGDWDLPPPVAAWPWSGTAWGRLRNRCTYAVLKLAFLQFVIRLNAHRRQAGLAPYRSMDDSFSRLAQLSILAPEFDFPRRVVPRVMQFVGPFSQGRRDSAAAFPFERLDGRPLVYASLGTMLGLRKDVYHLIAEACSALDCQLVIGLGGCLRPDQLPILPGDPLVAEYAPQVELLRRASLVITHGGLNSVMEALGAGVPMVVIPFSGDQPGIAARAQFHGVGVALSASRLRVDRLRAAIRRLFTEPSFREQARRLSTAVSQSGGLRRAADIVEQVLATGRPVLAGDPPPTWLDQAGARGSVSPHRPFPVPALETPSRDPAALALPYVPSRPVSFPKEPAE